MAWVLSSKADTPLTVHSPRVSPLRQAWTRMMVCLSNDNGRGEAKKTIYMVPPTPTCGSKPHPFYRKNFRAFWTTSPKMDDKHVGTAPHQRFSPPPPIWGGRGGGGGAEPRAPTTIFKMRPHLPAPSPQQCTKQFDDCAICGSIVLRVAPTPLAWPSAAPPHMGGGEKTKGGRTVRESNGNGGG